MLPPLLRTPPPPPPSVHVRAVVHFVSDSDGVLCIPSAESCHNFKGKVLRDLLSLNVSGISKIMKQRTVGVKIMTAHLIIIATSLCVIASSFIFLSGKLCI